MSIAAAHCWFSALSSSGGATSTHSVSSNRLFCTSCRPHSFSASKSSEDLNQNLLRRRAKKPIRKSLIENEAIIEKFPPRSRDAGPLSNAGGRSSRNTTGQCQSTSFRSLGVRRKVNKGHLVDSKEQQGNVIVSFGNIRVGCEGTVPFRSTERIAFRYLISQKGECEDSIRLKLLTKARYSMARFKGEQIVILSQVLKLNGTWIRNIHHLARLVDSCKDKYLVFEFEDNFLVVLERESALAASTSSLKGYGIPSERSSDLLEPYLDSVGQNEGYGSMSVW